MKKAFILTAVALASLSGILMMNGCNPPSSTSPAEQRLSGTITISGAFALYPITVRWAEEFMKLYPGVTIDVSAGGAGKGLTDVLAGMADLGMFSRELTRAESEKGAWHIAVARDAVLPVANSANPDIMKLMATGLSREKFQAIYISRKIRTWGEALSTTNTQPINIYTRSDACGAGEMWAAYLGGHQEDLSGTGVFGDPGIASAVKNDRLGIGYNNVIYVYDPNTRRPYDGLKVIPVDLNDDGIISKDEDFYNTLDEVMGAIRDGIYPSPPSRPLYFVSKGKPSKPEVVAFLRWILEQGQSLLDEAGYVAVTPEVIVQELQKLE